MEQTWCLAQCSVFPVTTYQCTQIYEPWRCTAASSPALKKHDSTIPSVLPPHNPLPKRWPPLETKAMLPKVKPCSR
ncbi:hypothetical protein QQF64_006982 [Cirrhinus molitorella]|uniref:Uncharacterized protein n=1 Tax=Cirrhinus molitorella TaxID=172907 RepID=A0ABR3MCS0_9TELE